MPNRNSYETYTVVKGDTLSAIAKRFGSSVSAIATASGISDPNKIAVGQQLLVPVPAGKTPPLTTSAPKSDPRDAGQDGPSVATIPLMDMAVWFEPPRLWFTLALLASAGYYLLSDKSTRKRK